MTDHPITPPPELVQQWHTEAGNQPFHVYIAAQAARWGADQELEACCEFEATVYSTDCADKLRRHRRPKQPSLKEQALEKLAWIDEKLEAPLLNHCDAIHTIRRALDALPS
jgi:hypothetical protein